MPAFPPYRLILLLACLLSSVVGFSQSENAPIDKSILSDYFQNEQYAEAISYLRSRRVTESTDINSINALGYAYFMQENYEDAELCYAKTLSLDSLNFTANRYSALLNNNFKNYTKQLFYYQRLLNLQPSNALFYKLTADTYLLLKNQDTALDYYAKGYKLQPQNLKIALAYADLLLEKEMFATADSVAHVFLVKDSLNVFMLKLAIKSFLRQKKWNEAASFSNNWIKTGETDPKTTVSLAQANYYVKEYQVCFKLCDTLLQQGIETEALLYYASQAKYKLNEYTKSNELLKQCLELAISKNTNIYYFSRAENFEALKQYNKAIATYDTAFHISHDPLSIYNIGRIYEEGIKNKKMANQYYKKYITIAHPKSNDEKRVYAYVKEFLASSKK